MNHAQRLKALKSPISINIQTVRAGLVIVTTFGATMSKPIVKEHRHLCQARTLSERDADEISATTGCPVVVRCNKMVIKKVMGAK